jgi:hypothetical protein
MNFLSFLDTKTLVIALTLAWLPLTALWIMGLVDVTKREFEDPNMRMLWLLVMLVASAPGAIIYLLVGRKGGTMPPPNKA